VLFKVNVRKERKRKGGKDAEEEEEERAGNTFSFFIEKK